VSPQFHVRYDDNFVTIRKDCHQPRSMWQSLCGFEPTVNDPESVGTVDIPVVAMQDQRAVPLPEVIVDEMTQPQMYLEANTDQANQEVTEPVLDRGDAPRELVVPPEGKTTRSGREIRMPSRYHDYVALVSEVEETLCVEPTTTYEHPIALAASSDPDVLYMHEALAAPDRREFIKAMEKEIRAHTENSNWKVIRRSDVPPNQVVLPSVWAVRRKRDIATHQVYKWKARLNVHGGKQIKDFNYWETYAPVASWSSIRVVMNMAASHGWVTRQLDFVLAFPQAPVESDIYMEIPAGFEVKGGGEVI
jgi:Reverse transcriptase (RNA-dependent DNA polymerase)